VCAGLTAYSGVPLENYAPVVDTYSVDLAKYNRDRAECWLIAIQAEAASKQWRDAQLGRNILAGAVIGTVIGSAAGIGTLNRSDNAKKGVVFGALVGTADSTEDIKLGPRRIMDRCIANRRYDLLKNTL
jgi:hypothetical protein